MLRSLNASTLFSSLRDECPKALDYCLSADVPTLGAHSLIHSVQYTRISSCFSCKNLYHVRLSSCIEKVSYS